MLATTDLWFRYQDEPVLKGLTLDFSRHAVTGFGGGQRLRKVDAVYEPERPAAPAAGGGAVAGRGAELQQARSAGAAPAGGDGISGSDQQIFYTDIDSDIAFSLRNLGVAEEEIARRVDEALTLVDAGGFASSRSSASAMGRKNGWQSPGRWCCRRATCCLTSPPRASIHAGGRR